MKTLILLCCIVCTSLNVFSQTWTSSCVPTGDMQRIYRADAARLALHRMITLNSPWKDSVIIPDIFVDSIAAALYAIENMAWTPLKDTIMNMFGFRNFNISAGFFEADSSHTHSTGFTNPYLGFSVKKIIVSVDASSPIGAAWAAGNYYNTPNQTINSLLSRHALNVSPWGQFPHYYRITSFSHAINPFGLAAAATSINGITYANSESYVGDDNYISAEYQADGIKLRYRNGCGDCPMGCTYETNWFFKVSNTTCNVEYLGRSPLVDGETAFQRVCSRGSVMPVSFTSIKASLKNKLPQIEWQVGSDADIHRYSVERSAGGNSFKEAATITSKRSANGSVYLWIDEQPFAKASYYRIKAVTLSGSAFYSPVVKVNMPVEEFINVYPNPVRNHSFVLQMQNVSDENYTLRLLSITGKSVFARSIKISSTPVHQIALPATVTKGIYILKLDGSKSFRKIVVVE